MKPERGNRTNHGRASCMNWGMARIEIASLTRELPPGSLCHYLDHDGEMRDGEIREWGWCQEFVCAYFVGQRGAIPIHRMFLPGRVGA